LSHNVTLVVLNKVLLRGREYLTWKFPALCSNLHVVIWWVMHKPVIVTNVLQHCCYHIKCTIRFIYKQIFSCNILMFCLAAVEIFILLRCCAAETGILERKKERKTPNKQTKTKNKTKTPQKTANLHRITSQKNKE